MTSLVACGGRVGTGEPDPGAGGGGATGSGGTGSGSGGTVSRPGSRGTCWRSAIPDVEPIAPTHSIAESCSRARNNPVWSPAVRADASVNDRIDGNKALLVGRWVACDTSGPQAIEFGSNNRWRHLVASASDYVPVSGNPATSRGTFYLLGVNGQLNLRDDRVDWINDRTAPWGGTSVHVETVPDQEAMRVVGSGRDLISATVYARAAPSPSKGWDNPPNTESEGCRLVGTWDGEATNGPNERPASFGFDDAGNFVGAPGVGVDLCVDHPMYGTYALSSGVFQLTTNVGMGSCSFWLSAGYLITFNADCSRATVAMASYDNCTGGRRYFNNPTTLVKRP